jgi:hypothetical protein
MATSKPQGTFHDAITGETITRDLTAEEIAELLKSTEDEE